MANPSPSMDFVAWLRKQLQEAHPDLLREMVSNLVQMLMSAEADALCGAGHGERDPNRVNSRNGYRRGEWMRELGRWSWRFPGYVRVATSRTGCWRAGGGRNGW